MKKTLTLVLTLTLSIWMISGCAWLQGKPDNTKTTTTAYGPDGMTRTGTVVEETSSDIGSHNEAVSHMVTGSLESISKIADTVVKANDCNSYSGEARAWCASATNTTINNLVSSATNMVPQVVRDMKKPTSGYDVLNNMIDKNTIPMLGAMGVVGWITEALSGAGQTVNNVSTEGGAIGNSFNKAETHLTGNPTLDGASQINIPFLPTTTTTTTTTNN